MESEEKIMLATQGILQDFRIIDREVLLKQKVWWLTFSHPLNKRERKAVTRNVKKHEKCKLKWTDDRNIEIKIIE